MTKGYASDVNGDETVMDSPDCIVTFDVDRLSREQAITLGRAGEVQEPWALQSAQESKSFDHTEIGTIEFHIPFEKAVMMLMGVGVIEDGPTDEAE